MRKTHPGSYEVGTQEGLRIQIDCVGTGYEAFGNIGTKTKFTFPANGSQMTITPSMLAGMGSTNRIHVHVVYNIGATPTARYVIVVLDENGTQIDDLGSRIDTARDLPYRDDFTLIAEVV